MYFNSAPTLPNLRPYTKTTSFPKNEDIVVVRENVKVDGKSDKFRGYEPKRDVEEIEPNEGLDKQSNLASSRLIDPQKTDESQPFDYVQSNHVTTEPNVAPYKAHPLFHYLKNENTLEKDNIISFRNGVNERDVVTLILKPVANALAGVEGKAMAMPLSRAVLRQGTNVDILYEPVAFAIVGPGGIAHAQSDLEIGYEDY